MSLPQIFRVLWAQRRLFISIMASALFLALAASLLLPKIYLASASVVVDLNGIDPLTKTALPLQMQASYLATQVDVIKSHNVALRVVERAKLTQDEDFVEKWRKVAGGRGEARDWIADELLRSLTVRPSRDSNVINIEYAGNKAKQSAQIANLFADSYIQTNLDLKVMPAKRQAAWFAEQIEDMRKTLEAAQQKMFAYQKEHGVVVAEANQVDVENARLEEITKQLVAAQSMMYEAEMRQRQSESGRDDATDISKNPLLQALKADQARADATLAQAAERYGKNHPLYQRAAAEAEAMHRRVGAEIANSRGQVSRDAQVARQQAADLQRALEQQRNRILQLSDQHGEYAVLKREVDNAKEAYDAALQRSTQARLESRQDLTNIAVLNEARVPLLPDSPRLVLNLVLALILGFMLAAGVTMIREVMDRRVHSRDDLWTTAQIAVLAELPPNLEARKPPLLLTVKNRDTPRLEAEAI